MEKEEIPGTDLQHAWPLLSDEDRLQAFRGLSRVEAEDLFFELSPREQAVLILSLPAPERRSWVRILDPDDAADMLQEAAAGEREGLIALLDEKTQREVRALLAYQEDRAGGVMNTRYARVRPDMSVDEAIRYLNVQTREGVELIYYVYVLDPQQHLLGVVSFRELFQAPASKRVREVMKTDVVKVSDQMDQEQVARVLARSDLMAIPVIDPDNVMKGIVTLDDVVDVVQEEATEDIHKMGGSEALDAPYLDVSLGSMVKKRAGWLTALFLSEMLTATAMGFYEHEIAKAVVLALFVPLIISSGGNTGSQATTLVIRAMALGEIRLLDWFRVIRRELAVGMALGAILGAIGFSRILVWQAVGHVYGPHYMLIALTVSLSLVGVVLWGTVSGSMLPFILRRLGFDPASASAPFVATLVDVTGLIIYFSVASVLLRGTLL